MAKRFIDTEIFQDPFIRGLEAPLKTLWVYLFCTCDGAGLWPVEVEIACLRLGIKATKEKALKSFEEKIIELDNGLTWFIPSFIKIQYKNELKSNNKALLRVIPRLLKYDLIEEIDEGFYQLKQTNKAPYQAPLKGHYEGAKEKEKEEDKEKEVEKEEAKGLENEFLDFEVFWELYAKKVSLPKCKILWSKLKASDREAIMEHIPKYKISSPEKQYRKNPETYLRNRAWEDELISNEKDETPFVAINR